jgi:simple sugar transport system permease protein
MERNSFIIRAVLFAALLIISFYVSTIKSLINNISVPLATVVVVGLLCVFNVFILKTKAGQDFRSVGQDMNIAKISGIPVDKIRIRAILISTVLAGWGQLIFLQNIGTLNTYGSHEQVGTFAIAALLIGGASVTKATIGQAIIGTALFHTLFIVSPQAGKNLFGNAQIGEYFRVFVAYGVIGVSLGLHAWKQLFDKKNKK